MAANREGVGNIKPVRALCPFYCVCNTCIHIYIYIAHGSGAHSRSLACGTDVPLPGRLPGPALVGPLQGPLRVLGPPGGIRPGPAALAPRSRARRDSIAVVQFCVAFDCESAFWGARGGGTQVINVLSSRKFPEEFPKTSAAVGSWMVDDHD